MSQTLCTQAVVLVGGEGTRLRPVTSRVPKPAAPLVCRPFIGYVLENLARHGVEHVIFSAGYLAETIERTVGDGGSYGLRVSYVVEDEPLGTAGAFKNAEGALTPGRFFALNGDVLTDVDLSALAAFHVDKGGMATIYLTPVEDPRRYGLVLVRPDASVSDFLEKPGADYPSPALINAGIYVLEPEVLEMIPAGRMFSIERGVFPRLAQAGSLYGFEARTYWRDIGTPESYLAAHFDVLDRSVFTSVQEEMGERFVYISPSARVEPGARIVPPAYVADGATVAARAQVGPLAVIGPGTSVAGGASVVESVLQEQVTVGEGALVRRSIVVRHSRIGSGSQVSHTILGEGCQIGAGNELARGIALAPGTILSDASVTFRDIDDEG